MTMALTDPQDVPLPQSESQKDFVEPLRLGERLKAIRLANRWTLKDVGLKTGIAGSTLSKIENDQLSPSFAVVQKLISGLGIDLPQLLTPTTHHARSSGRRDLTREGLGKQHPTPTYEHELLSLQLTQKHMVPFKTVVRARHIDDFAEWIRHDGEEFLLILKGNVLLYSEFYEPLPMAEGDSLYFDSAMGHALISTSTDDALILSVCTQGFAKA